MDSIYERLFLFLQGSSPDAVGGLYIRSAQFDHTGRYTCIARTLVDSANASAHLQVLGRLIIMGEN